MSSDAPKAPLPQADSTPTTFTDLVEDVLHEIAGWLTRARDRKNLGLSSRRLWSLLALSLYSDLEFYDHDWAPCLTALQTQPELIKQVQSLKLHTENFSNPRGYPLSRILADLVVRMPNLQTFVWDLPWAMDAGLWEALKPARCPKLRTLGIFCSRAPVPRYHMKSFSQIRSLHVRANEESECSGIFADASQELWRTIRDTCSELEEIAVTGNNMSHTQHFAHSLLVERWPQLRQLSIGGITLFAPLLPGFLDGHSGLDELRLHGTMHPLHSLVATSSLGPCVQAFEGTLWQATLLIGEEGTNQALRSLHITDHRSFYLLLSKPTRVTLASLLSRAPHITHLRLEFICEDSRGKARNLRLVLASCPQLRELDLAIAVLPFLSIAKTAEMLRETVPLLTRLSLSLVPAHREAGVGAGARVLVAALPHLREVQIRYLWDGNVRADQALRPPRKLGEFEVLPGGNLVTLFEGKLRDTVTMRGPFGRLQLRRPDPAMRRRHFPSHGWRWYVAAIDKPRRAADTPGEVTKSLQHAASTSAACERVFVFVVLGVLVGLFAIIVAHRFH